MVSAQSDHFKSLELEVGRYIQQQQWDEVILKAPDLIIEDPTRGVGHYYIALAFLNLGDAAQAANYLTEARKRADADLSAKLDKLDQQIAAFNAGRSIQQELSVASDQNPVELALQKKKLWELDKNNISLGLDAVTALVEAKKYAEALEILESPAFSNDAQARMIVGKLKSTPEIIALNAYKKAMQSGQQALEEENFSAAAGYFKEALEHRQNDPAATASLHTAEDELAWKKARNQNSLEALDIYLAGKGLKKHASTAHTMIRNTLTSEGKRYLAEGDLEKMESYFDAYLQRYPNDEAATDYQLMMCTAFNQHAEAYLKTNTLRAQQLAVSYFSKAKTRCPETGRDDLLARAEKRRQRFARPDRSGILYSYSPETPFGLMFPGFKNQKIGSYFRVGFNAEIFKSGDAGTVNNRGEIKDASGHYIFSGNRNTGDVHAAFGLTKKITYPLWAFVGAGASYRCELWEMIEYNNGSKVDERWMKNTDNTKFKPLFEAGLMLDLSGFSLMAGGRTADFSSFTYLIGVGFSLL